jgi:site-specific DNA recombinase
MGSNELGARRNRPGASGLANGRRRYRCAIYTRKSSDEGLEQSFNSLDAQREACQAYVTSQKHEGWTVIADAYDDGGFSGGSMQRPALQRLLADIAKGRIDIVVVYKVDRLTRSLADFAKLTELLDRQAASFVSVTQQFNTSTSMGRLTLNVLLSFAQFEREVAGERIRDKIALSKRRGMWMGGHPPLGYDGVDRQLVINDGEAETVRLIFERYLAIGSIAELKRSLDDEGVVSKRRTFGDGRTIGGVPISRGALYQILRNRLYRGEIAHRGEVYNGNHQPIVDDALWDAVQERLAEQSQRQRIGVVGYAATGGTGPSRAKAESEEMVGPSRSPGRRSSAKAGTATDLSSRTTLTPSSSPSPLIGFLFDEADRRLTPSHSLKKGKRYRYYVSAPLTRGETIADGFRVPASDLEKLVLDTITHRLRETSWLGEAFRDAADLHRLNRLIASAATLANALEDGATPPGQALGQCRPFLERIVVAREKITIILDPTRLAEALGHPYPFTGAPEGDDESLLGKSITISVRAHLVRGKQVRVILGEVVTAERTPDPELIQLVIDAARWFEDLRTGKAQTIRELAQRDGSPVVHISRTLPLAFLAPDIVELILAGRQPPILTAERLRRRQSLPISWPAQRQALLE